MKETIRYVHKLSIAGFEFFDHSLGRKPGMTLPKKFSHSVIVKSPGLLPMLYKVRELAQTVGVAERTLRDWLADGLPHRRDAQGHLWIHGRQFAGWVQKNRKRRQGQKLEDNQAYCLRCKRAVELLNPETQWLCGKLTITRGTCASCGAVVQRGGRTSFNSPSLSLGDRG
jgi:hypothetical protein